MKSQAAMYQPDLEAMPIRQLRELQDARLRHTLAHLESSVSFYQEQWREQGSNLAEVRGVRDLHRLPFTRKDDLRDQYPFGMLAVPSQEVSRIHASSGTTGNPTVVAYTPADIDLFAEVCARSLYAAGARPDMKLHNAYGYGLFTGGLGMHYGGERLGMAVVPVSGGMTDRQLKLLQDFAPEVICCTPSYALTLADACKERSIDPDSLAVRFAVLGAEPWTEAVRAEVEAGLGVTATNIYGLSEIIGPGVSQEPCDDRPGSHVWEDHFYPEIVDPRSGEPVPEGQDGVLVLTTLTKQAMPLVRYWTNDITHLYYDAGARRTHVKMGPIKGRSDDMLIIRGVNLFPTQVEAVLGEMEQLSTQYQLVVRRSGTMDSVLVRVESATRANDGDIEGLHRHLARSVRERIKSSIGLTMEVEVAAPYSLPRSEGGKLSRVVDER